MKKIKVFKMDDRKCLIVLVGLHPNRLKLSIDKEIVDKLIFIKEKEYISGTDEKIKVINELNEYYQKRLINTEILEYSFTIQTRPVAELTYTICQQKLLGFNNISVNISGGLRFMVIWCYISCLITNTNIIHGDFKYKGKKAVGINDNMKLVGIPLSRPTEKQFEFLELFFTSYNDIIDMLEDYKPFEDLMSHVKTYNSIEDLRIAYGLKINNKEITRGSINGYIQKLKSISALETMVNPETKIEKIIKITYLGIAFVLNYLVNKNFKERRDNQLHL